MNRRNKRTSSSQYKYFLDTMEANPRLAANTMSRANYTKKWKEMGVELNKCQLGPKLSAEEWRKVSAVQYLEFLPTNPSNLRQRLNDWKNSTRSKYRRCVVTGDRGSMSALENRCMRIFFVGDTTSREPAAYDDFSDYDEEEQEEEFLDDEHHAQYQEPEASEGHPAVVLINGVDQSSAKRIRLQNPQSVIYEVEHLLPNTTSEKEEPVTSFAKEIQVQINRLSKIQEASLDFKIARFKYKNPGFEYNLHI
ncbi:hypothetical protein KR200_006567 [Drosophila serrata]|nr:hypothetical protein KR200_006567 [Drosophila serrata]